MAQIDPPDGQCRYGRKRPEPIEPLFSEKLTKYWGGILDNRWARALAALTVLLHAAIALPVRPLFASADDGGWIRHSEEEFEPRQAPAAQATSPADEPKVQFVDFEAERLEQAVTRAGFAVKTKRRPRLRQGLKRLEAPKDSPSVVTTQSDWKNQAIPLIDSASRPKAVRQTAFQEEAEEESLPFLLPESPEIDDFAPITPMAQPEAIELAPLAPEPVFNPQPDYIQPVFGDIIGEDGPIYLDDSIACDSCCGGNEMTGIGRERVMHAPFVVTTSQPFNHYQFGLDLNYNFDRPNRAEYLWAGPPAGPLLGETHVDYQDFTFRIEAGTSRFSTSTTIPFRAIDPEIAGNHFGFSNMIITTKTVLLDGRKWQITQLLNTYLNTGSAGKGLGNGHTTMEPGVLVRYEVDPYNYLHGEMKYWFPIGGNKLFEGQVFSSGLAWSHLAVDTDDLALIYTLEGTHSVIESGRFSPPGVGVPRRIDGHNIFTGHIGARMIWDTGGDLGVIEYGLNYGVPLGGHQWSEHRILFNVRFSF